MFDEEKRDHEDQKKSDSEDDMVRRVQDDVNKDNRPQRSKPSDRDSEE